MTDANLTDLALPPVPVKIYRIPTRLAHLELHELVPALAEHRTSTRFSDQTPLVVLGSPTSERFPESLDLAGLASTRSVVAYLNAIR